MLRQIATESPSAVPWIRRSLAGVFLLIGLSLTVLAYLAAQRWEAELVSSEFQRLVGGQAGAPQAAVDLYLESIQSMGAYIGATGVIRQNEFRQYAQDMITRRPGIRSVAWVPRIFDTDRQAHELAMRAQGFDDYQISACEEGDVPDTGTRSGTYFPITYLEPLLYPVLGFCMQSTANWQQAMDQARDQGEPVATESLFAVGWQELDEHPDDLGFELGVFQPVYHYGLPSELGPRRANLRGFLFIIMQTDQIVQQALRDLRDKDIEVTLLGQAAPPVDQTSMQMEVPLNLADYQWTVAMAPASSFIAQRQTWQPLLVLLGGLLLSGLLVGYLLMLMGRTARVEQLVKEAQAELKESEAQLIQSEKMASIGQMVAGMVHEINTPLGYVKSSVDLVKTNLQELLTPLETLPEPALAGDLETPETDCLRQFRALQEDGLPEETQVLLENAHNGLEQIARLVTNLKDFSRLDRERIDRHDLNRGLEDALIMVHHLTKKNITIHKQLEDGLPLITCAPAQINQVFLNLLVNAAQAIKQHRDSGEIRLHTWTGDGHVHVGITDNGIGIAPEHLEKIFEPFHTTKKSGQGTGLGLAIARKIITEHGGSINVESSVGEGTTFQVSLPLGQGS